MSPVAFFQKFEAIKERAAYARCGEPAMGQEDLCWLISQLDRLIQPELPLIFSQSWGAK